MWNFHEASPNASMDAKKNIKLALANVTPKKLSAEDAQSPDPANTEGIILDNGKASIMA